MLFTFLYKCTIRYIKNRISVAKSTTLIHDKNY